MFSDAMNEPRELRIEWRGLSLAALEWGSEDQPRVLALHGWMDNAASFIPLASLLNGFHIIAPDFVGHGRSDHRPHSCGAHFIDWVADVLGLTEALGWGEYSILGHSMGAAIGAQTAAVAPDVVQRLVLLDGFGPLSDPADEAPARLAKALDAERRLNPAEIPPCRTVEDALKARMRSGPDLGREAARLLVERGTEPCVDGLRFRHDPRLRLPSRTRLTEDQVLAFLQGVSCPVLAIRPRGGWPVPEDIIARRLGAFSDLERLEVEGGHHVHLTHPERVADAIGGFLRPSWNH
ncbi:MAG: alpha/beta hydrolase [Acidobacteria bacterium]|nr:MAG: alpha/beta hydrolase [Acidobacteriota bacterium]